MRRRLISLHTYRNAQGHFNERMYHNNLEQTIYLLEVNTGSAKITMRLLLK